MPEVSSGDLTVIVPESWQSVGDNGPYALSRRDGVGYLQFCVAFSACKLGPVGSGRDMLEMVLHMSRGYELGKPSEVTVEDQPMVLAAASFIKGDSFWRLWELSDGVSLVSAIYTCLLPHRPDSLDECERIVRSAKIEAAPDSYKRPFAKKGWQFWR